MQLNLRHTLLMITAVFLMASCSSDGPLDDVSASEIRFEVSAPARSAVTTPDNVADAPFAIFGDSRFGSTSVIFNGDAVAFADSKWSYSNTQFWMPKHEYSFVALHPREAAGISSPTYADSELSFGYTLPDAFGDTPDLVVATHRRFCQTETGDDAVPVTLKFDHILSRVNFLVKNDKAAETAKVTRIELAGVNRSGNVAVTPAALLPDSRQTGDYLLSWSGFSDSGSLSAAIEVDIPDGETLPLFPDDNALLVVPQPDNNAIDLRISYTLIFKNGRTEHHTVVSSAPIGRWQHGKVYTYAFSFVTEPHPIEITVTVSDWKQGSDADVSVPRK